MPWYTEVYHEVRQTVLPGQWLSDTHQIYNTNRNQNDCGNEIHHRNNTVLHCMCHLFKGANHLSGVGGEIQDRSHHAGHTGHQVEAWELASSHQTYLQCGGNLSMYMHKYNQYTQMSTRQPVWLYNYVHVYVQWKLYSGRTASEDIFLIMEVTLPHSLYMYIIVEPLNQDTPEMRPPQWNPSIRTPPK